MLFAAYLVLFSWLVTKVPFFKKSNLTPAQLIIILLLKISSGIFYGLITAKEGGGVYLADSWALHYESIKESMLLRSNPVQFFTNLPDYLNYGDYSEPFSSSQSWWTNLGGKLLLKINAVFHLFSGQTYFINVIFYSFLTLFGPIALYRVQIDIFPTKATLILLSIFLLPSFIYWTSGIHKDGVLFMGLALIVYHFYFGLKNKEFKGGRIAVIVFCLVLLVVIKNFLVLLLVPALLSWVLTQKIKAKPVFIYTIVYLLSLSLFFASKYIHPKINLPQAIVNKQAAFKKLKGTSEIKTPDLHPVVGSFLKNAPNSFYLATFRPTLVDVKDAASFAAALEGFLLLALFGCFIFLKKPAELRSVPFFLFCLFFSFSLLLVIGYTVNFLGAIVRYRSIILPFLVIPMIALIDWNKIRLQITGRH